MGRVRRRERCRYILIHTITSSLNGNQSELIERIVMVLIGQKEGLFYTIFVIYALPTSSDYPMPSRSGVQLVRGKIAMVECSHLSSIHMYIISGIYDILSLREMRTYKDALIMSCSSIRHWRQVLPRPHS